MSSKATATKTVTLKDLQVNLFVRKVLDQDRVMALAELIAAGVALDPIKVTPDLQIVDGRHRKEAYELCDRTETEAVIMTFASEAEMIAEAYRCNVGGALPPTKEDTEHTVSLLLEHGESMKKIGEMLGLPAIVARTYAKVIQSKAKRVKLQSAAAAVTDGGLTVMKAAEQYEVEPDELKEVLHPSKRRGVRQGIAEMHRELTTQYRSVGSTNAAFCRKIVEKVEDGDISVGQADELFDHLQTLQEKSAKALLDRRARFNARYHPPKSKTG